MENSLTRFDQDGLELFIDTQTGEAFASISGYARMVGLSKQAVSKRLNLGVNQNVFKTAEVPTDVGLRQSTLIPASTVFKWAIKDKPELAEAMGLCGATVYLHQLAGYQIKSEIVVPKTALELAKEQVLAAKEQVALLEKMELLEAEKKILEEETLRQAEVIDELFDHSSIIRIAKYNNVPETTFNWRQLTAASRIRGLEVKKAPCPRFVTKNLYSHDAWRLAYPGVSLPDTTTLFLPPTV
jgi:hypothetical protein